MIIDQMEWGALFDFGQLFVYGPILGALFDEYFDCLIIVGGSQHESILHVIVGDLHYVVVWSLEERTRVLQLVGGWVPNSYGAIKG